MNPPCTRKTERAEDVNSHCPDCKHPTAVHPFVWRVNSVAPRECLYCQEEPTEVGEILHLPHEDGTVPAYLEGGPGRIRLIAMSDGTVRWSK